MCPADVLPVMSTHSAGSPSYWGPFAKTNYCGNIGTSPAVLGLTYQCGGSSTTAGTMQDGVWNGMLTFSNHNTINYCVRIADVTDGTSNTAFVGEVTVSNSVTLTKLNTPVFPAWAGGPGNSPGGSVSLTATSGNEGDACGNLQALGNVFRFMDGNYPINSPSSVSASDNSFGSQHEQGSNFLFVDGSVHYLSSTIAASTYQALGTRNGGEGIPGY
jgi:prepilin-type processing-associated H-X9-DG protein